MKKKGWIAVTVCMAVLILSVIIVLLVPKAPEETLPETTVSQGWEEPVREEEPPTANVPENRELPGLTVRVEPMA